MYWKTAWNRPTLSVPLSRSRPASSAMTTWASLIRRRMTGATALARKSANAPARASSSASSQMDWKLFSSSPKALMTARPVYASSTLPESLPMTA